MASIGTSAVQTSTETPNLFAEPRPPDEVRFSAGKDGSRVEAVGQLTSVLPIALATLLPRILRAAAVLAIGVAVMRGHVQLKSADLLKLVRPSAAEAHLASQPPLSETSPPTVDRLSRDRLRGDGDAATIGG